MKRALAVIALVAFGCGVFASQAHGEDWVEYELPTAQRSYVEPLPLDCQIPWVAADSFILRCRINIGVGGKWIKGPKPVAKLPPLPTKKKKVNRTTVRAQW